MTQRSLLRFLLVGLPIGLAASIGVAVYLYYRPLNFRLPGRPARLEAVDLIRKSPSEKDLVEYRRILTAELPTRSTGSPAALSAAANWLASTLGPTNLGLPVKMQNIGTTVDAGRNIVIELPGRKATAEVIVVCTAYDADNLGLDSASSTALLMTVANAFVGLPQQRTVVFAFLCRDQPPLREKSGVDALLAGLRGAGRTVRGVIDVRVRRVPAAAAGTPIENVKIECFSEQLNDLWSNEVWQALSARQPPMVALERFGKGALDQQEIDAPLLSRLTWWRQTAPPPVPFLLLVLRPAAPDDADPPLALAQALEGVVQTLANQ